MRVLLRSVAAATLLAAAVVTAAPAQAKPSPIPTGDPVAGPAKPHPDGPVGGAQLGSTGVVADPAVLAAGSAKHLPTDTQAAAWLVADLDTGAVLAARNPHGRFRPASTLKELTALTALPAIPADSKITFTKEALTLATQGTDGVSSLAGLTPGYTYTAHDLFLAMMLPSGNDAAEAIAAAYPGGRDAALAAMNAEAARLHADDTYAATPDGLDAPRQVTSPYDLALIARAGLQRPDFAAIVKTKSALLPCQPGVQKCPKDGHFSIQNHNHIVTSMPGALGVKNGYTTKSKQVLVGAAEQNGHRIVAVLMNCDCFDPFTQDMHLLQWGLANDGTVAPVGTLVAPVAPAAAVHAAAVVPDDTIPHANLTAPPAADRKAALPHFGPGRASWPGALVLALFAAAGGWVLHRRRVVARRKAERLARRRAVGAQPNGTQTGPVSHRAGTTPRAPASHRAP